MKLAIGFVLQKLEVGKFEDSCAQENKTSVNGPILVCHGDDMVKLKECPGENIN